MDEKTIAQDTHSRMSAAIRMSAPGTSLRRALDMIIAGHLGALICIGDSDSVIAAGNDGFILDISFTANRLFELSKMDGAIVIDKDVNQILRANYHLNPDPALPTSETGMRHRTAARMSLLTKAVVISVSERRQVVNIYVDGRAHQLRTVPEVMSTVNQVLVTLQSSRNNLDRGLLRLSTLELENHVTLADITSTFANFELLMAARKELENCIDQLGSEGKLVNMQLNQLVGDMDDIYELMIRDYAVDSSEQSAAVIRAKLHEMGSELAGNHERVGQILGYEGMREDSVIKALGLRTLSRITVVRDGMAEKIVDEYGNLQNLADDLEENPDRLDELGIRNVSIVADSLHRMRKSE
ncbi:MAG: DNA integrity scanning diadenylate cyclase DisA [Atopobiaceae bacterium]|nr:DNA integrity scanning diadenylate cyclase DisA [Atopobiaceae bacterium]